jgi:hypothetical protein
MAFVKHIIMCTVFEGGKWNQIFEQSQFLVQGVICVLLVAIAKHKMYASVHSIPRLRC